MRVNMERLRYWLRHPEPSPGLLGDDGPAILELIEAAVELREKGWAHSLRFAAAVEPFREGVSTNPVPQPDGEPVSPVRRPCSEPENQGSGDAPSLDVLREDVEWWRGRGLILVRADKRPQLATLLDVYEKAVAWKRDAALGWCALWRAIPDEENDNE